MRPGGVILITDYCRGDKEEHSEAFLKYVHQRGYHLLTVEEYGRLLEKVSTMPKLCLNLKLTRMSLLIYVFFPVGWLWQC